MWVPRTGVNASGFWLTPTASDWKNMDTAKQPMLSAQVKWPTPTVNGNYNRKGLSKTSGDGLATAVKMCKTPSAADAYTGNMKKDEFKFGNSGSLAQEVESGFLETHRKWPTPRTSDANGHSNPRIQKLRDGIPTPHQLREAVAVEVTGQLNPTWVEWLMGWPLGWTDLKRLETDKYQQWLQLHGRS